MRRSFNAVFFVQLSLALMFIAIGIIGLTGNVNISAVPKSPN